MKDLEIENAVLKNLLRETVRAYETGLDGTVAPPPPVAMPRIAVAATGRERPGAGATGEDVVLHNLVVETTRVYEEQSRELRRLRETLRLLLLQGHDAVILTDAKTGVVELNPVAEKLLGLPTAAAAGRPLLHVLLLVGADGQAVVLDLAPCLMEGRSVTLDDAVTIERRDGYRFAVAGRVTPIDDDAGRVSGLLLVLPPRDDSFHHVP